MRAAARIAARRACFEQVVAAENTVTGDGPPSMAAPGFLSGFLPVLEDGFLPAHVYDPTSVNSAKKVPLMVSRNGTEMSLFMLGDKAAYTLDAAGLRKRVTGMFEGDAATILDTYRGDFPDYSPSALWFRIVSDYMMGALSSAVLDARAVPGAAPVYGYRFDWMTPIADGKLFSPHTIEIPFVFDNVATEAGQVMTQGGAAAQALAKTVSEAWVTFARIGKPAAPALPDWPQYSGQVRAAMHLDTQSRVAPYMPPAILPIFHDRLWRAAGLA
ncbi:carboxylesterase family protein [Sphingomonas sp. ac-8]|uniref:carboxylesterase family protein n=1 Tax=Sphingomonas sp. ac-8 TaxID=3242977 RepID=UPI003A807170